MEHLLNCHGEIAALVSFVSSLPLVGVLLRSLRLRYLNTTSHNEETST